METIFHLPQGLTMIGKRMTLMDILFSFEGRISRSTFWLAYLALGSIMFLGMMVDLLIWSQPWIFDSLFQILMIWPSWALIIKRCHDRNRSPWFLLIFFIPILGPFWLIIEIGFLEGTQGDNLYGIAPDIANDAWVVGSTIE